MDFSLASGQIEGVNPSRVAASASMILVCLSQMESAAAKALPKECNQPSVSIVNVAIDSKRPELGKFPMRFESHHPKESDGDVTIVFVPSGPGNDNIYENDGDYEKDYFLTKQADSIGLEYRGVGCNKNSRLPPKTFSSEQAARDFLEVIRARGLKRYILFGAGYGSVVARMMAGLAREVGVRGPESIVNTGGIGRALRSNEKFKSPTIAEWNRFKRETDPRLLARMMSDLPLAGVTRAHWGNFILGQLWAGYRFESGKTPARSHRMLKTLERLEGTEADRAKLRDDVVAAGKSPWTFATGSEFNRQVLCREISSSDDDRIELVAGELHLTNRGTYCAGLRLDRPYDARDWPVSIPQYYLNGRRDPLNPTWQTEHAIRSAPDAVHIGLVGAESGHGITMSLEDCRESLWSAVLSQSKSLRAAGRKCAAPHSTFVR